MQQTLTIDYGFDIPSVIKEDIKSVGLTENRMDLNMVYGKLKVRYWNLEGILLSYCDHQFNDLYWFSRMNTPDVVRLEFILNGNFFFSQNGNTIRTKFPQHTMLFCPNILSMFRNVERKSKVFMIELQLPVFLRIVEESNDTLRRFADKVLSGEPVYISQDTLPMIGDMYQVVNDILECRYEGGLKKMFLLSKTIELMVIQAEMYDKASAQKTKPGIKNADVERLHYAKEYMTEKVSNPPNLSELSKIIGMSEYKLKQGFKKTFNTTVFGYLADYRLRLAQQALKENHRTISEIAYDLGYSSPQHFSATFKKKFGLPPRSVKS